MTSTLQAELKQARPFKGLTHEAFVSIARTAAILEHRLAQILKPHGITPTQYNVLRILRGAGADGLCRNEVGQRLVTSVPDVTRLLDRMEEQGLIVRERAEDRRFVRTRLTPKGLKLADRLERDILASHDEQLGHIGEQGLRRLIELLGQARAGDPGT